MQTVWESAITSAVNRNLSNPKFSAAIAGYLGQLNGGLYPAPYRDALGQKMRPVFDVYDAAAFANMHAAICRGYVLYTTIHIGQIPTSDHLQQENSAKLNTLERMTFYSVDTFGTRREESVQVQATFRGGSQSGNDGIFRWNGEIEFGVIDPASKRAHRVTLRDGSFPFEVGYTTPPRTLGHFGFDRAVARWPYGSKRIWLFAVTRDVLWYTDIKPATPLRAEVVKKLPAQPYRQLPLFGDIAA